MPGKIKYFLGVTALSLIWALTGVAPARAQTAPLVVTDIKSIHSLTSALMRGVGGPTYLVPDGTSPHEHTLRPSDAQALRSADLIIWMGPRLSPFLAKPLGERSTLNLTQAEGIEGLPIRGAGLAGEAATNDRDPHVWFDPRNADRIARAIAARLIKVNPQNQAIYQRNLTALQAELRQLDTDIAQTLTTRRATGFVLTHDSIQYLTHRYALPVIAILSKGPDHPRSLKISRMVRQELLAAPSVCVVGEPPYAKSANDTLVHGTKAGTVYIDPFGASIPAGPDHYGRTLRKLAKDLSECAPL